MNKADLRKLYLEKRTSLSVGEVAAASSRIAERFFESIDLTNVAKVHTFIPIHKFTEIDTSIICSKIWRDWPEIVTIAPRTEPSSNEIANVAFDWATDWTENAWGIREPATSETVATVELDLVVVPLLCLDKSGHRVGYGKGMYDRFLARCRPDCLKVGLDYFEPVIEISDIEPCDIRLDICVTPFRVYRFDEDRSWLSGYPVFP